MLCINQCNSSIWVVTCAKDSTLKTEPILSIIMVYQLQPGKLRAVALRFKLVSARRMCSGLLGAVITALWYDTTVLDQLEHAGPLHVQQHRCIARNACKGACVWIIAFYQAEAASDTATTTPAGCFDVQNAYYASSWTTNAFMLWDLLLVDWFGHVTHCMMPKLPSWSWWWSQACGWQCWESRQSSNQYLQDQSLLQYAQGPAIHTGLKTWSAQFLVRPQLRYQSHSIPDCAMCTSSGLLSTELSDELDVRLRAHVVIKHVLVSTLFWLRFCSDGLWHATGVRAKPWNKLTWFICSDVKVSFSVFFFIRFCLLASRSTSVSTSSSSSSSKTLTLALASMCKPFLMSLGPIKSSPVTGNHPMLLHQQCLGKQQPAGKHPARQTIVWHTAYNYVNMELCWVWQAVFQQASTTLQVYWTLKFCIVHTDDCIMLWGTV